MPDDARHAEQQTLRCHARICHRAGAQVNRQRPLTHATTNLLRRCRMMATVEEGTVPLAESLGRRQQLLLVKRLPGSTSHTSTPTRRETLTGESPNIDGFAAASSDTRKSKHYAS